ncbi:MAG: host-nuclease inhibitor Gam family protein [Nitrospira sp.]|nr:host-nuclease inhibitor Gam family protein [Nitrospira sp.]
MKTWNDAEQLLREVGLAEIRRETIELKMNNEITAVKERYAGRLAPIDADIAKAVGLLETFCREHRADMRPASKKKDAGVVFTSTFGKLAFRKCPAAIEFRKKVEKVLAALKAKKLTNCIRTVEEPNKDVLLGLDDATLAAVHCRKKPSEKFEVKPDYQEIVAREA